ncbi:hypothetical protein BU15DRAFT_60618 [Melanogaster broomeanus]|nr:hypothetical protein BU15DRAFT_60618 [Melanogaster broomeanus]
MRDPRGQSAHRNETNVHDDDCRRGAFGEDKYRVVKLCKYIRQTGGRLPCAGGASDPGLPNSGSLNQGVTKSSEQPRVASGYTTVILEPRRRAGEKERPWIGVEACAKGVPVLRVDEHSKGTSSGSVGTTFEGISDWRTKDQGNCLLGKMKGLQAKATSISISLETALALFNIEAPTPLDSGDRGHDRHSNIHFWDDHAGENGGSPSDERPARLIADVAHPYSAFFICPPTIKARDVGDVKQRVAGRVSAEIDSALRCLRHGAGVTRSVSAVCARWRDSVQHATTAPSQQATSSQGL